MRYVVFVLMGIFGVLLSGSLAPGLNIAGIQVDLLFLLVVSIAVLDKTSVPIIFAAASGLFMDIMYGTVLGVYAISYTAVAAVVMAVFRNTARFNFLMLLGAGVGGYLLKEGVMALLVYILGARFDFLSMFARYMLPSAVLNGVLLLAAYLLLSKLFSLNWMKPRYKHGLDDLNLV